MGNSINSSNPNFDELYVKQGFELPDEKFYSCEFEKKLFMAMNLFRANPSKFNTYLSQIKKTRPEEFGEDKKALKRGHLHLNYKEKMRPLTFNENAI
jgi:hypothetical protein